MFHVGQKVVCVQDTELRREITPRRGEVYTIRSIHPYNGRIYFRLVEIVNEPRLYSTGFYGECFFNREGFRPIVERKTDISFAHEILRKATKRKLEPFPSDMNSGG